MKSLLSIFLLIAVMSLADEQVELFGYYEPQMMGADVKDQWYHTFSNKLRIDLQSTIADNIHFAANFDYITYHGRTTWNILDFTSDEITNQVPEEVRGFYIIPFADRHFLDNAYAKIAFKHADVILGKQQISMGTGYVWNPTDIFNIKDVLDPTYEQPGHNALRLDVPMGRFRISTLYSPEDTWEHSTKLIQFKGGLAHFDCSLVFIDKIWRFHDYRFFDLKSLSFLEVPERRRLYGADCVGELLGLGVWAEYAFNEMQISDDFYELVVGADYTFDFQTYVMFEYYRNTAAKSDYREYQLNDWMRYFTTEQKAVTHDQLYALVQHPVTDYILLGVSTIYAISDNSVALVPTFYFSFAQNMDIFAYMNVNYGKNGTAFSKTQGNGLLVRGRVYF